MPPHFHQSKLILIREIIPKNKAVEFSAALSHTADFEFSGQSRTCYPLLELTELFGHLPQS